LNLNLKPTINHNIIDTIEVLKKIWFNITKLRKFQLCFILILSIISSIAEVISIGAVIPFLTVLAAPEIIFEHDRAQTIIKLLSIKEANDLIIPITISFVISSIIAGFMRWLMIFCQTKTSYAIGADISILMFKRTLQAPYSSHINNNSSNVISSITIKSQGIVDNILYPIIFILSSFIIIIFITTSLLIIDTLIALSLITSFGIVYLFISILTRPKLNYYGSEISYLIFKVTKLVKESLSAIRDLIISNTQNYYLSIFQEFERKLRNTQANVKIISMSPRFFVESAGIAIIAFIACFLAIEKDGLLNVIPSLGALILGAQRMLPLAQQIYGNWSLVIAGKASALDALNLLKKENKCLDCKESNTLLNFEYHIEIKKLSFSFNESSKNILQNINLKIKKGQHIGILGTTGSGKSTLLDIVMGLHTPTQGSIFLDNVEIGHKNIISLRKKISQVSQTFFLLDGTILDNIAFGVSADNINIDQVHQAAKIAQIHDTIISWENKYSTLVGEGGIKISGGQRQRIAIARALYRNSEILILDEATSALDINTEEKFIKSLKKYKKNCTVIMVAHRLQSLSNCDALIKLENGKIISKGSFKKIMGT